MSDESGDDVERDGDGDAGTLDEWAAEERNDDGSDGGDDPEYDGNGEEETTHGDEGDESDDDTDVAAANAGADADTGKPGDSGSIDDADDDAPASGDVDSPVTESTSDARSTRESSDADDDLDEADDDLDEADRHQVAEQWSDEWGGSGANDSTAAGGSSEDDAKHTDDRPDEQWSTLPAVPTPDPLGLGDAAADRNDDAAVGREGDASAGRASDASPGGAADASTSEDDDSSRQAAQPRVPEDVQKYARFTKMDGAEYRRVNDFLRERTYITAREWAIARLCSDFRTETGVEMTKIGENLPQLVPFMTDTYTPQAVNQARSSFEGKVRKAGATFLYGAMCDFFTAEELDDVMYEVTEVAKFLLEVEGVDLAVEEELAAEERISSVMREVREASAELRREELGEEAEGSSENSGEGPAEASTAAGDESVDDEEEGVDSADGGGDGDSADGSDDSGDDGSDDWGADEAPGEGGEETAEGRRDEPDGELVDVDAAED